MHSPFHHQAVAGALLLTLLCSACGGGGGASPSIQPATPAAPVVTPPVVTPPVVTPPVVTPPVPAPAISLYAAAPAGAQWTGLAIDPSGNFLVVDRSTSSVMKITPAGVTSVLAGNGQENNYVNVDGVGTAAVLRDLEAIVVDGAGNAYVTNNDRIRKITPAGVVTTFYVYPVGPNNLPKNASAMWPVGLGIDSKGTLVAATYFSARRIAPDGKVTMISGDEVIDGYRGSVFAPPIGVTVDVNGNAYIASFATITRADPAGATSVLTTTALPGDIAGGNSCGCYGPRLAGAAIDSSGRLYVIDASNGTLVKLSPDGTLATLSLSGTVNGQPLALGALDNATGRGLVFGPGNALYTTTKAGIIKIVLPSP